MKTRLYHLQALSAVHVGTGQGVGAVDLPIARSRATNLPIIAGSAVKGVLREEWRNKDNVDVQTLFGADNDNPAHAGAVAFGDAQLLLLPIRSFAGTVAYATCPFILKRYQRDLVGVDIAIPNATNSALLVNNSALLIGNKIALEDLDIDAQTDEHATKWANTIAQHIYPDDSDNAEQWRKELKKRFVILPDNQFSFLADTATEIRMRIRIDKDTRIVAKGALWSEENLPCETVLWGVMGVSNSRNKNKAQSADELSQQIQAGEHSIQIGGKHTVGRGLCRLLIAEGV